MRMSVAFEILLCSSQFFAFSFDPVVLNSTSVCLIPSGDEGRDERMSGKKTEAMEESDNAAQRHVFSLVAIIVVVVPEEMSPSSEFVNEITRKLHSAREPASQ